MRSHRLALSRPAPVLAASLALALTLPAAAPAKESAASILRQARERHIERIGSVRDVTIVQTVDGAEQIVYLERREVGGHPELVPVGPLRMMLASGALDATPLARYAPDGNVLEGLRDAVVQAAATAGLEGLRESIVQSGSGPLADFLVPLLTPSDSAAAGDPQAMLAALTSPEHLKRALVEGAKRAAMREALNALLRAAAPELEMLLRALQGQAGPGQLLGEVGKMLAGGLGGPGGGMAGGAAMGGAASAALGGLQALGGALMAGAAARAQQRVDEALARGPLELDAYEILEQIEDHARLAGFERLDGAECFVLVVDELARIDEAASRDFRNGSLTLWLDRGSLAPRRVLVAGEARIERDWMPIELEAHHTDFRQVEDLLLPFRSTARFSGLSAGIPPEEREEMRRQMEQMERELEKLPPEQRAMVERMMRAQMPQLEAMLSEEGPAIETVVREVRVDQGPPEELLREARQMAESIPRPGG